MKRGTLVLLCMFAFGVALRVGFGLMRPTDDLAFYISNFGGVQFTRFGFEKNVLFYPLQLLGSENGRVIALAVIMSALNTIAALRLLRHSGQNATFSLLFLVLVNSFFAQIDMHLVRQQIAIYLFLMAVTSRKFGISVIILSALSITYHEVAALLFCGWLAAWIIQKRSLDWAKRFMIYLSFGTTALIFLQSGNLSVLFLLYTLLAFFLIKKESVGSSLGVTLSSGLIAFFIIYVGQLLPQYVTPLALERAIGVFVSLGLFRLLFDGEFQRTNRTFKWLGLMASMSFYGLLA